MESLSLVSNKALHYWERWRLDTWGLVLGGLLFASASTPSLLPRPFLYQGMASGFSAASGYAFGLILHWHWRNWGKEVAVLLWKKFARAWGIRPVTWPSISKRTRFWGETLLVILIVLWLFRMSYRSLKWHRELYALMEMDPDSSWNMMWVVPIGVAVWLLCIFGAHLVMSAARFIVRITPDNWSVSSQTFLVWILVIAGTMWAVNTAIPGAVVRGTEKAFATQNRTYDEGLAQVTGSERSGSPASFNSWEGLGAAGSRFVSGGLRADELEELTGRPSKEPIRLYSGLGNGDTDEQRADLLVAELNRTRAQDRAALMIVGTTGTGWANPTAAQSFELLFDGNTATIATQYSYFPSPIQFVSDKESVRESGRILIGAVLDWWQQLPKDHRPKLYLFGESLGSTQTEGAFSGIRDISNSVDGVLWVGPPNGNDLWRTIVTRRDVGSPEVQAEYAGGQTVRFAQDGDSIVKDEFWQFPRVLYLQHPSDPIVWWSPRLIFHEPDWLKEPAGRGRHVSMEWSPFVTFWQVSIDLLNSVAVPDGYGHNYGTEVLDGLAAISGYQGDVETVRAQLEQAKARTGD
ncbi:alpha/beta hydrolase [Staphylococcus chromogenes]|nr:alpha/beta hydrolase [Staphylococcus chromogenes]